MSSIKSKVIGKLKDGRPITGYTLSQPGGLTVTVSDYGGAIWELSVPDKNGKMADVVLGYDSVENMENSDRFMSTLIGRWGNRIAGAKFTIDQTEYRLKANDGVNHVHGGDEGFDRKFWTVEPEDGEEPALVLSLLSPDGEEGYPGNLSVKVTYKLGKNHSLSVHYQATTDRKTVVNLTNHAYFNLGGYASGKIYDHILMLDAQDYLETDERLIPTGRRVPVEGTPFDFRQPKAIGRDLFSNADNADLKIVGGYDHCLNFSGGVPADGSVVFRGFLKDPVSGRRMNIYTDSPCVQLYTSNALHENGHRVKGGLAQKPHIAVCLETQRMPDSMHHEGFTSPYLAPGETYDTTTIFEFVAE